MVLAVTSDPPATSAPSRSPAGADLAFPIVAAALLFLAWTSVMLPGFAFPMINNFFHVPIVLDYAASAEGPHDAFVASLGNFVSLFWPALGLVATEGNISGYSSRRTCSRG